MQPNIFMWGGLLKSILESDLHIILDTVKSSKNSRYNRNKIAGVGNPTWLTIPYVGFKREKQILNQSLDTSLITRQKIITFFANRYSKSIYFDKSLEILKSTLSVHEKETNICIIYNNFLNAIKNIGFPICPTLFASNILGKGKDFDDLKGVQLINKLLEKVSANIYLASENTLNYASPSQYNVSQVWIQKFTSKSYLQNNLNNKIEFIPNLSILDMTAYLSKDEILTNLHQSNKWEKYFN